MNDVFNVGASTQTETGKLALAETRSEKGRRRAATVMSNLLRLLNVD